MCSLARRYVRRDHKIPTCQGKRASQLTEQLVYELLLGGNCGVTLVRGNISLSWGGVRLRKLILHFHSYCSFWAGIGYIYTITSINTNPWLWWYTDVIWNASTCFTVVKHYVLIAYYQRVNKMHYKHCWFFLKTRDRQRLYACANLVFSEQCSTNDSGLLLLLLQNNQWQKYH